MLAKAPSGKRDFQAMQEAFNRWEEQSGLDLTSPGNTTSIRYSALRYRPWRVWSARLAKEAEEQSHRRLIKQIIEFRRDHRE